jgi:hypothetical protein
MESDSSPPPDNFDPIESRPDVMSISDNLQGLSLQHDSQSNNNRGKNQHATDIMILNGEDLPHNQSLVDDANSSV